MSVISSAKADQTWRAPQPADAGFADACGMLLRQPGSCRRLRPARPTAAARLPRSGPSTTASAHLAEIPRRPGPSNRIFRLIEVPSQEYSIATDPRAAKMTDAQFAALELAVFPYSRHSLPSWSIRSEYHI